MNTVRFRGLMKYLIFFLYSSSLLANSLRLEVGQTKALINSFAIPNTGQDRVSLPVDDTLISYRLTGFFDLQDGNQIYFLVAPLATNYKFKSEKNFEFNNEFFSEGEDTEVYYKFNSYRLGYLWRWNYKTVLIWAGLVGKIRDAQIEVSQGETSRSFDNIGFVPLASFGFEYYFTGILSLYSHTDGLSASQGSAYDSQIEMRLNYGSTAFSLGKRILGGGVDNDDVFNSAQFDTYFIGFNYEY